MLFLLQFRGLHNDLRIPEFLSIISLVRRCPESSLTDLNLTPAISTLTGLPTVSNPKSGDAGAVLYGEIFYYINLHSPEEALVIAKQCVLLRAIYIPVSHGNNYETCIASIDQPPFSDVLAPLRDPTHSPTFRCHVDAFGKSLQPDEQLDRIHRFSSVLQTFPGKVRMRGAKYQLHILEDAFPRAGHGRVDPSNSPRQVFLALHLASGRGELGASYSLKRRRYIGPTSMDAELAFVMASFAKVKAGDFVADPLCGTGGILVACAARGAVVVGADINILALRGQGKEQNVCSNFKQYQLPTPIGLFRADVLHSPIRVRNGGWFDAVVCDPPYGIKEGMKVFREDTISPNVEKNHFQGTVRVRFVDFLQGLLNWAADALVENGRLVYWLPTTPEYTPDDVPTHPGLRLLHNCEQPLTMRMSRRLITMERVPQDVRRMNEEAKLEQENKEKAEGVVKVEHVPAHFDLARKLLRQPERAEQMVRARDTALL